MSGGVAIPQLLQVVLVFFAGALATTVLAGLSRAAVTAGLETRGHRLDRWRRVWFHPEREMAFLVEALLILSFLAVFLRRYAFPLWVAPTLVALWALHLPADLYSWLRARRRPEDTRELHERGFLLLDLGPLGVRVAVVAVAAGLYFWFPPVRAIFEGLMTLILASFQRWFS